MHTDIQTEHTRRRIAFTMINHHGKIARCIAILLSLLPFIYTGHECKVNIQYGYFVANCQNLGLTDIPWTLQHSVHKLHFENNNIRRLRDTPFSRYERATQLLLNNNSMEEIGPSAFRGLKKLELLDLENNHLTVIPTETMKYMPKLSVLILRHNKLTYIDNYAFAGLNSLKELFLTNNQIINVAPNSFANLVNIEWFSLRSNLLRTIDKRVLTIFGRVMVIRLYENPWQCDCSLRWLKKWLMKMERTQNANWRFRDSEPTCRSPPHVAGMKFSQVSIERFACPAHITSVGRTIVLDKVGETVIMECRVIGDPRPSIVWYKNGYVINDESDSRYKIMKNVSDVIESQLKITDFDKRDVASYLCVSSNPGGTYNITYNVRLRGYKPKYIAPVKKDASNSSGLSPLTATTIIAAVAGSIVLIMAIALILGIICCHRRSRNSDQFAVKLDSAVTKVNGLGLNDHPLYEDIKYHDKSLFHEIHGDSPYESMKPKQVDNNEPRYCTYISFRSDPSDPDDLTNCYIGARHVHNGSRDHSHTESTSPLLEGYRMNVPSPRFLEQMYEHNSDYCNTLPHAIPYGTPPSERRSTKRSTSAGSLSNMIPPKKPPRLHHSDSPTSENTSFGSIVMTPNGEMTRGTPL